MTLWDHLELVLPPDESLFERFETGANSQELIPFVLPASLQQTEASSDVSNGRHLKLSLCHQAVAGVACCPRADARSGSIEVFLDYAGKLGEETFALSSVG
jgi:hypothetical protein